MTASGFGTVAFLGIGLMGSRQARRLLDAGHRLTVWNRSRDKAEALAPFGAHVVDTPSEAVAGADVVVLMLENGAMVQLAAEALEHLHVGDGAHVARGQAELALRALV